MDLVKVTGYMNTIVDLLDKGANVPRNLVEMLNKVRATEFLDQPCADVLFLLPIGENAPWEATWEHHLNVGDTGVGPEGSLMVEITGHDADGDHTPALRRVVYPAGRWLKMNTELKKVPNPWYLTPIEVPAPGVSTRGGTPVRAFPQKNQPEPRN